MFCLNLLFIFFLFCENFIHVYNRICLNIFEISAPIYLTNTPSILTWCFFPTSWLWLKSKPQDSLRFKLDRPQSGAGPSPSPSPGSLRSSLNLPLYFPEIFISSSDFGACQPLSSCLPTSYISITYLCMLSWISYSRELRVTARIQGTVAQVYQSHP